MGLDTTHDCWHGPYSSFHRWRVAVANAVGIDLTEMAGFEFALRGRSTSTPRPWSDLGDDPIVILLSHSDCDGEIAAEDCAPLADRLEELLPEMERQTDPQCPAFLAPATKARTFISGLRRAAAAGEPVEFR